MRKWHKIEYFHPEGKSMPNGINYHRGWFSKECRNNMDAFGPVSPDTFAILILPRGVETLSPSNNLLQKEGGGWTYSNQFTGRFVHCDLTFDINSPTIEIKVSSSIKAKKTASKLCESHKIRTAIMKVMPHRHWYDIFFEPTPRFYIYNSPEQ